MLFSTTPKQSVKPPAVKIHTILIDVFKCELIPLTVNWANQREIHDLLDCDLVQSVTFAPGARHILWVDESGLLREPFVYPQFRIEGVNGNCPLTGYGLITGFDYNSRDVKDCTLSCSSIPITFEAWARRINSDLCIEQMLRIYFDR